MGDGFVYVVVAFGVHRCFHPGLYWNLEMTRSISYQLFVQDTTVWGIFWTCSTLPSSSWWRGWAVAEYLAPLLYWPSLVFLGFSRFWSYIRMIHCQEVESLRGSDQWVWTLSSSRLRIKSYEWLAFCKGSSLSFLVRYSSCSGICKDVLLNVCVFLLILHNSRSWMHLNNLSLISIPNSRQNPHSFWTLWFCAKWFRILMNLVEST